MIDQYFIYSILDSELEKSEVKTIEELLHLLQSTSIKPKPDVEDLDFIWNWRDFIEPHLNVLKFHSFYNGFNIKREFKRRISDS